MKHYVILDIYKDEEEFILENERIFNESKMYMPGGVNSPVRAYRGMSMTPPIIKSGKGVIIVDEDGNEYIDFVLAYGPLLLGHCHEKVVEAIKDNPTGIPPGARADRAGTSNALP